MTNSVQNSFNLQVLYKMLKKHTNLKVHICPQMRVKLITKKKYFWICGVVFTEKHGCREFLFDGQSHHDIIGVYSTFSRPKTLDCILVINDISNFHKLYIYLFSIVWYHCLNPQKASYQAGHVVPWSRLLRFLQIISHQQGVLWQILFVCS